MIVKQLLDAKREGRELPADDIRALIAAYAVAYSQMHEYPVVMKILQGVRPAVAGMMLAMGWNMSRKAVKSVWGTLFVLAVAAVVVAWNPPLVLFILAAIAAGIAWNAVAVRRKGAAA